MNTTTSHKATLAVAAFFAVFTTFLFAAEEGESEEPVGPHGGRLLEDGGFQVELAIAEGDEPEFQAWAYQGDELVPAKDWQLSVTVKRLDGEAAEFRFVAASDYLRAERPVEEPHSFDITATARHDNSAYAWEFTSYEGRVHIDPALATELAVTTTVAEPGTLRQTVRLYGTTTPDPLGVSHVTARYPGLIRSISADLGDHVEEGAPLAVVEANSSLQTYTIAAPISGTVIERHANPGEFAGDQPLLTIADYSRVWVDLHVFPGDARTIQPAQPVTVRMGPLSAESTIRFLNPGIGNSPNVIARVPLGNPEGLWTPGLLVEGDVVVDEQTVDLRVNNLALQTLNEEQGVFIKVGSNYEFRPLELGRRDESFTEVLEGLDAGTEYVVGNSYLLKADVEKAGATHEH